MAESGASASDCGVVGCLKAEFEPRTPEFNCLMAERRPLAGEFECLRAESEPQRFNVDCEFCMLMSAGDSQKAGEGGGGGNASSSGRLRP